MLSMTQENSLEDLLLKLLRNAGPVTRRKAFQAMSRYWQQSNARRIRKNIEVDGGAMQRRSDRGKSKMFRKLGRHLKRTVSDDQAEIGFSGRTGMIAERHHEGERFTNPYGQDIDLPVRELLGASAEDKAQLIDIMRGFVMPTGLVP